MRILKFEIEKVSNGLIVKDKYDKIICKSNRDVAILIGDTIMNHIDFDNPIVPIEINIGERAIDPKKQSPF